MIFSLLYLSITFVGFTTSQNDQITLESVAIIHRHGDRTPIATFPTDVYLNESYWPDGWGQLTKEGKERMYQLGRHFRNRYSDFLTNNPREVHLRSSDVDRCLESAALIMAGAYPPQDRWIWSENISWLPFPIHTVPANEDGMLVSSSDCPKAAQEQTKLVQSSEYQNYMRKYEQIISYVASKSGYNITSLFDAVDVFDALHIEKIHSYSLPDWVTPDVYNQLNEISDLVFWLYYSTKAIQKLRSGVLMKDIYDNFMTHVNRDISKHGITFPKLFMYSTHDTVLAVVLNALGSFNMLAPPFGSCILIELYSTNNHTEYFLQFKYMNETPSERSYILNPSCCNLMHCEFHAFFNCIQTVKNWRKECIIHDWAINLQVEIFTYILVTFFMAFIIILFLINCLIYFNREKAQYMYRMIPII